MEDVHVDGVAPVFKLAELAKLYQMRLDQLGVTTASSRSHSTRLKAKLHQTRLDQLGITTASSRSHSTRLKAKLYQTQLDQLGITTASSRSHSTRLKAKLYQTQLDQLGVTTASSRCTILMGVGQHGYERSKYQTPIRSEFRGNNGCNKYMYIATFDV